VTFGLVILCVANISKSEYVWSGKEWIWKESVTESNVDGSGEDISTLNDYEINSDASGDGTLSDSEELEESTIMSEDNEMKWSSLK
jgi:hypothetical protein